MINTKILNGFWKNLNSIHPESTNIESRSQKQPEAAGKAEPINRNNAPGHKVSANKMVVPVIVILAILHVIIIFLIMKINQTSSTLASIQRNAGTYTQQATAVLAGTSLLSETTSTFILLPQTEDGSVNAGPLIAYVNELNSDRRADKVLEKFQNYEVSDAVRAQVQEAVESSNFMLENQLHALSLMNSIYHFNEIEPLKQIPLPELTEEEKMMPAPQKEGLARSLVLSLTYSEHKGNVSACINQAQGMIQRASGERTGEVSTLIGKLRTAMWFVTSSIIVILIITFTMLFKWILQPLGKFAKQIPNDSFLDETKGFEEITVLAKAYNDVLKRRNALDAILRSAAETDALTNLQNRYSFERYLLESEENTDSIAVLLFDVNYLKQTNDTMGHLAGDRLICNAAECISNAFGEKCYRFGGDEFAAIVEHCTPESLKKMIEKFTKLEKERNVSISYGYAYTDNLRKTTFKKLINEADGNMYEQKRLTHKADEKK